MLKLSAASYFWSSGLGTSRWHYSVIYGWSAYSRNAHNRVQLYHTWCFHLICFLGYKGLNLNLQTNPLGMSGAIAESYNELLKNLWSGKNDAYSPKQFKVISIPHSHLFSDLYTHTCTLASFALPLKLLSWLSTPTFLTDSFGEICS